jgi:hypothetical protein
VSDETTRSLEEVAELYFQMSERATALAVEVTTLREAIEESKKLEVPAHIALAMKLSEVRIRALKEFAAKNGERLAAVETGLMRERNVLLARVAALESQLQVAEPIDREAYEVYRRGAMYLATYVAGARVDHPDSRQQTIVKMWGDIADKIEEARKREESTDG